MSQELQEVELGFLERCEPWQVESCLFPSKLGGKPSWLNLSKLPSVEQLQCKTCLNTMIFLCQIYAPYEEDVQLSLESYVNNFHRTLFVFICRNSKCCQRNTCDNIKILRSSLQRDNKYYSYDPPEEKPNPEFSLSRWVKLCILCGCLAEKQCSRCKTVHYCSRQHQVIDWKEGHKQECGTGMSVQRRSKILFPEWEIITVPEEIEQRETDSERELEKFKQLQIEGKTGTMSEISECDLDAHASVETDKVFVKFQKTISSNPDQIIRYQRDGAPLWIAREPVPDHIPNCQYCGGPRRFEFQIMPQLLSLLQENDVDWGVIAIYTCIESCGNGNDYKEEFVFKQDVELKNI